MIRHQIIEQDLQKIVGTNLPWNEFEDKIVLVSGASGFLPAYIVETLLYLNEQRNFIRPTKVIGIIRDKKRAIERLAHYQNRSDFELIVQDICFPFQINQKIDYIIHAASQASPKYFGSDPVGTLLPNVVGTHNLLKLAREKKVKGFLFFSAGEIYGFQPGFEQVAVRENDYGYLDPLSVRSCYAESKRMGETMCVSYHHQFQIPIKIARIGYIYGPGMRLDDGRAMSDFISNVVNNKDIILTSDGKAMRTFCYISDATIAFFMIILQGKIGETYNVGTDKEEISILELAKLLVQLFPERNLHAVHNKTVTPTGYLQSKVVRGYFDISKINQLDWYPTTLIRDGLLRTIRSYQ